MSGTVSSLVKALERHFAASPDSERYQGLGCRLQSEWRDVAASLDEGAYVAPDLSLAQMIDHTNLSATARLVEVEKLCAEAVQHEFATVCVNGSWIATCRPLLAASDVGICAVVGFPLGAMSSRVKQLEAECAVSDGASEVDVVFNLGWLKDERYGELFDETYEIVEAVRPRPVKVIVETAELTDDEKTCATLIVRFAGAAFVKTSTGFGSGGATEHDVRVLRRAAGAVMGVKASGGIRNHDQAMRLIEAGASRLGTSSGVRIVTERR